jgi:histone acetyltransferase
MFVTSCVPVQDFGTIEHKLHINHYNSLESFVDDVQLVFDNCRTYNPEGSIYAKNATRVEKYFRDELAERTKQEE